MKPEPVVGTHSYAGSCDPTPFSHWITFSVGVFQWVKTADGKRVKRTKAKVRVKGLVSRPEEVYAKAAEIVQALDAGTYKGPRVVDVSKAEKETS